jgi:predicted LPLAT superfamily acyltransferase
MSNDFEIYDAGSAISALVARASYEFHFEETDGTWKVTNRDDRATALREAISLKRSAIERFKADAPS